MEEIWKDIEGYYGLYQISNKGNVKSLNYKNTKKEKLRKISKDTGGYLYVPLSNEFGRKNYLIHRLVAEAFIPNPENLPQVNHKNEDKTDNRVENLEFCDNRYNSNFGTRNERIAKTHTGVYNTKRSKKVLCIETGKIYPSTMEIQRQLGFAQQSICHCCNGKLKTVGKLHWKYVD